MTNVQLAKVVNEVATKFKSDPRPAVWPCTPGIHFPDLQPAELAYVSMAVSRRIRAWWGDNLADLFDSALFTGATQ